MSNSNFEVALAKEVCPVCAKEFDGPIIMNTYLTEEAAKKVKDLHQKPIGYMKEPCKECQEYMKQGVIVIGIDPEKTESMSNPYRSGAFAVVKPDLFERQLGTDAELDSTLHKIIEKRVTYMDHRTMIDLGMIKEE